MKVLSVPGDDVSVGLSSLKGILRRKRIDTCSPQHLAFPYSCRGVAGVAEIPRSRVRRETERTGMRARVWGWTPGRAIRTARVRALPVVLAGLTILVMTGGGGGQAAPRT